MEVTRVLRVLLGGARYLIPTTAVAKAGRRMTFVTPLQFFVLKNDIKPHREFLSVLS